jgi:hypothetical protein
VAFCRKPDWTAAKNEEPLTAVEFGVATATDPFGNRETGEGS